MILIRTFKLDELPFPTAVRVDWVVAYVYAPFIKEFFLFFFTKYSLGYGRPGVRWKCTKKIPTDYDKIDKLNGWLVTEFKRKQ